MEPVASNNKPSILSFDAVADAEKGSPLTLQDVSGADTPLTVFLRGDDSDEVQKHVNSVIRQQRAAEAMAKKAGKEVDFDLAKINEQNVVSAAIRAIGWTGVDEPFDIELFKRALRRNPHWVDQIVKHSGERANFTKKPLTT